LYHIITRSLLQHSMIGYWQHPVVSQSVRLSVTLCIVVGL